jgi:hypothetical protein
MIEQLIIDIENTSDLDVLIPILQERKLKFRSNGTNEMPDDEKKRLQKKMVYSLILILTVCLNI